MALNDRVVVGDGYNFKADKKGHVMVYKLVLDEHKQVQVTPDGSVIVAEQGGVEIGSTGHVVGPVIKTHRSYLRNPEDYVPGGAVGGSNELVALVPVMFDKYQQQAYVPVDKTRIV